MNVMNLFHSPKGTVNVMHLQLYIEYGVKVAVPKQFTIVEGGPKTV